MRLSVAAVVAFALTITLRLFTPDPMSTTWADVIKAIGPVTTIQYSSLQPGFGAAGQNRFVMTYSAGANSREDTWLIDSPADGAAPTKPPEVLPSFTNITRTEGREVVNDSISRMPGQPIEVSRSTAYFSPALRSLADASRLDNSADVWRTLGTLAPEAVLKRGSEMVNGERLLRFEIIKPIGRPELAEGTMIWVNPKTKQPVKIQPRGFGFGGAGSMADIRFNEPIPTSMFEPPAVPDDLDAMVNWQFNLPYEPWKKGQFTFRVLDSAGEPIVTEKDIEVNEIGSGPGQEGPANGYARGDLTQAGVDKLDRFLARHPGEDMTIQINGEEPVKRKAFGRLSRTAGMVGSGRSPVTFEFPSVEAMRAMTRPANAAAVDPNGPGMRPGTPGRPGAPAWRGAPGGYRPAPVNQRNPEAP